MLIDVCRMLKIQHENRWWFIRQAAWRANGAGSTGTKWLLIQPAWYKEIKTASARQRVVMSPCVPQSASTYHNPRVTSVIPHACTCSQLPGLTKKTLSHVDSSNVIDLPVSTFAVVFVGSTWETETKRDGERDGDVCFEWLHNLMLVFKTCFREKPLLMLPSYEERRGTHFASAQKRPTTRWSGRVDPGVMSLAPFAFSCFPLFPFYVSHLPSWQKVS